MGIYLNPGMASFEMALRSPIYVDKTGMIDYLNTTINTQQRFLAVSRPRRFGKTMAADMICAYYDKSVDSRPYFEYCKIAETEARMIPLNPHNPDGAKKEIRWDTYLNQFYVLRLNMIDFIPDSGSIAEMISWIEEEVIEELMDLYPDISFGKRKKLWAVMEKIYGKTKEQFIIVIDEWDCVFRKFQKDKDGQVKYLDFLRKR